MPNPFDETIAKLQAGGGQPPAETSQPSATAPATTSSMVGQPFTQWHKFQQPQLRRLEIDPETVVRSPAEAVGKIPVVGPALSAFVPSTPGGWGAAAATTALAPATAPVAAALKLAPWLIRAGQAGIGGILGSFAGPERDPLAAIKEGAEQALGQATGEKILGPLAGKGICYVSRLAKAAKKPISELYGAALTNLIPGIKSEGMDPTW